jgi:hypothetical protein
MTEADASHWARPQAQRVGIASNAARNFQERQNLLGGLFVNF